VTSTSRAAAATWWPWLLLPAGASAMVASGLFPGAATDLDFGEDVEKFVNVPLALGFSAVAAGIWATRPDTRGLHRLGLLYTVVGLASAIVFPAHAWANAERAVSNVTAAFSKNRSPLAASPVSFWRSPAAISASTSASPRAHRAIRSPPTQAPH